MVANSLSAFLRGLSDDDRLAVGALVTHFEQRDVRVAKWASSSTWDLDGKEGLIHYLYLQRNRAPLGEVSYRDGIVAFRVRGQLTVRVDVADGAAFERELQEFVRKVRLRVVVLDLAAQQREASRRGRQDQLDRLKWAVKWRDTRRTGHA